MADWAWGWYAAQCRTAAAAAAAAAAGRPLASPCLLAPPTCPAPNPMPMQSMTSRASSGVDAHSEAGSGTTDVASDDGGKKKRGGAFKKRRRHSIMIEGTGKAFWIWDEDNAAREHTYWIVTHKVGVGAGGGGGRGRRGAAERGTRVCAALRWRSGKRAGVAMVELRPPLLHAFPPSPSPRPSTPNPQLQPSPHPPTPNPTPPTHPTPNPQLQPSPSLPLPPQLSTPSQPPPNPCSTLSTPSSC